MTFRINRTNSISYSADYKAMLFRQWYNAGKPRPSIFNKMIVEHDPFLGNKPSSYILGKWMKEDWDNVALELDTEVVEKLEQNMIAEKVRVLERHAVTGVKMQDMAMKYLDEHGVGSARNAIELLVKGLEIERISVGAPKVAAKMMDMTDEQLLEELKQLVSDSPLINTYPNDGSSR